MEVFLSCSGRQSQLIAEALHDWLPSVNNSIEPWISSSDIEKGGRWGIGIADQLQKSNFGIICLTPENLESPWIMFEAGALSKIVEQAFVWTYLFKLKPTDVKGPLVQFQHTIAEKEDTKKMLLSMNRAFNDKALTEERLKKSFEICWPTLEEKINVIKHDHTSPIIGRSEIDLLEESLNGIRKLLKLEYLRLQKELKAFSYDAEEINKFENIIWEAVRAYNIENKGDFDDVLEEMDSTPPYQKKKSLVAGLRAILKSEEVSNELIESMGSIPSDLPFNTRSEIFKSSLRELTQLPQLAPDYWGAPDQIV